MLPTLWGCCSPVVPTPLRSLVALPTKNQDFPRIQGNIYLLTNWKIMVKSNFAGRALWLQPSALYIPTPGLQIGAVMCPMGHRCWCRRPPSTQRVPSQNGIISLAEQSTMCFLLGFPWRGGKRSAKLLPIPPSWCLGTTRYLKQ